MTLLNVLSCSQLALNLCFISVKCKRHTEKRLKYFTVWLSYHEFESCSLIISFLFTRKAKVWFERTLLLMFNILDISC